MEKILMHKNIEVARLAVRFGKIVGCTEILNKKPYANRYSYKPPTDDSTITAVLAVHEDDP